MWKQQSIVWLERFFGDWPEKELLVTSCSQLQIPNRFPKANPKANLSRCFGLAAELEERPLPMMSTPRDLSLILKLEDLTHSIGIIMWHVHIIAAMFRKVLQTIYIPSSFHCHPTLFLSHPEPQRSHNDPEASTAREPKLDPPDLLHFLVWYALVVIRISLWQLQGTEGLLTSQDNMGWKETRLVWLVTVTGGTCLASKQCLATSAPLWPLSWGRLSCTTGMFINAGLRSPSMALWCPMKCLETLLDPQLSKQGKEETVRNYHW